MEARQSLKHGDDPRIGSGLVAMALVGVLAAGAIIAIDLRGATSGASVNTGSVTKAQAQAPLLDRNAERQPVAAPAVRGRSTGMQTGESWTGAIGAESQPVAAPAVRGRSTGMQTGESWTGAMGAESVVSAPVNGALCEFDRQQSC